MPQWEAIGGGGGWEYPPILNPAGSDAPLTWAKDESAVKGTTPWRAPRLRPSL
jgi:hypothetical protein